MTKYRNKKTEVDGVTFDSKREAARWGELRLLERAGHIRGLERQVPYVLAPGVKFVGAKRAQPALRYISDFVYVEGDMSVVEDVKGAITDSFRIKRHLMKSIFGIDIRVIR